MCLASDFGQAIACKSGKIKYLSYAPTELALGFVEPHFGDEWYTTNKDFYQPILLAFTSGKNITIHDNICVSTGYREIDLFKLYADDDTTTNV